MTSPDEQPSSLDSPSPPTSPDELPPSPGRLRFSPLRTTSDTSSDATNASAISNMTASSQPLGNLSAARRLPNGPSIAARGGISNPDIAAKMKAFSISRQTTPAPNRGPPGSSHPPSAVASPGPTSTGFPAGFKLPPQLNRPGPHPFNSSPAVPGAAPKPPGRGPSLAEKRGMKLGGLPGQPSPPNPVTPTGRQKPGMTLSQLGPVQTNGEANRGIGGRGGGGGGTADGGGGGGVAGPPLAQSKEQSQMERYAQFIDTKNGALTFAGKATVTGEGINFAGGKEFRISLDEVDTLDELGKGNYGTVYKVRHARPKFRRQGQGLAGNKALVRYDDEPASPASPATPASGGGAGTSSMVMAMKEMRLELDDAKFASIIMELDILHRCCASPYIVDFYGAFFQEGAVYICMEWMDGGSMDKLYGHGRDPADDAGEGGGGVPEGVLRKMTHATVLGLKSLKEEHNIIHRDVKPTNILANTRGQIKICDFGVSGNLVASIAKTNIGCHSYMAPERISSGGVAAAGLQAAGTYGVQSDVWSLGLTIIECGLGRYPYPPETYENIFSQLSVSSLFPPLPPTLRTP